MKASRSPRSTRARSPSTAAWASSRLGRRSAGAHRSRRCREESPSSPASSSTRARSSRPRARRLALSTRHAHALEWTPRAHQRDLEAHRAAVQGHAARLSLRPGRCARGLRRLHARAWAQVPRVLDRGARPHARDIARGHAGHGALVGHALARDRAAMARLRERSNPLASARAERDATRARPLDAADPRPCARARDARLCVRRTRGARRARPSPGRRRALARGEGRPRRGPHGRSRRAAAGRARARGPLRGGDPPEHAGAQAPRRGPTDELDALARLLTDRDPWLCDWF
jgi:hypothetical protein